MDQDIASLHRRLKRSKFALFVIVALLAVLTFAVLLVSRELDQQALIYTSRAEEEGGRMTNTARSRSIGSATACPTCASGVIPCPTCPSIIDRRRAEVRPTIEPFIKITPTPTITCSRSTVKVDYGAKTITCPDGRVYSPDDPDFRKRLFEGSQSGNETKGDIIFRTAEQYGEKLCCSCCNYNEQLYAPFSGQSDESYKMQIAECNYYCQTREGGECKQYTSGGLRMIKCEVCDGDTYTKPPSCN